MAAPNRKPAPQLTETEQANRLMTEAEAAAYLGFKPRALQNWRARKIGPPTVLIGDRGIRYRAKDLDKWVEIRVQKSPPPPDSADDCSPTEHRA